MNALFSFIGNTFYYPKKIYNFITKSIDFINHALQFIINMIKIVSSIIIIIVFFKMYKFFRKYSFEKGIKIIINKISEISENLFQAILTRIGLKSKMSEAQNDQHLREQIKSSIIEENINVKFDDIAELDDAKDIIMESIFLPKYIPNFFKGLREPWKGILFYGPPGTGKTLLAKAIASEIKGGFFNVKASSIASKWVGESEKLVKILFEMARLLSPSIIFIDEIDSIARKRSKDTPSYDIKTLNELLVQMDGLNLNDNVLVVGATNRPFDLDEAILRRFQKAIYIPLPSKEGRKKMFKIFLKNNEYENNIDFDYLAEITEGYNGSDIYNLCKESTFVKLRKIIHYYKDHKLKIEKEMFKQDKIKKILTSPISYNDILLSFENSKKSVSNESIEQYEQFLRKICGKSKNKKSDGIMELINFDEYANANLI